ncbi:hypothetical protein DNTS_018995 [Danionella cerebrum]|uniref:Sulfatase N-terminal domain-containing protein n=1 Tax=Danionella cerebrum TaxID=2873325 RepID=A0A553RJH8_9TELE|nr:hypothetical protein DNTS_018995 [Danionella translucida]
MIIWFNRVLDGHDLMPLLSGRSSRSQHEFLFHYCGMYLNAVRWSPPERFVKYHETPLVFDLLNDPSESIPLTPESDLRIPEVLERVWEARALHRMNLNQTLSPPAPQLSWSKILWRPWMQPCCGARCSCSEE